MRYRNPVNDRVAIGISIVAIRIVITLGRLSNGTDRLRMLAENVP